MVHCDPRCLPVSLKALQFLQPLETFERTVKLSASSRFRIFQTLNQSDSPQATFLPLLEKVPSRFIPEVLAIKAVVY